VGGIGRKIMAQVRSQGKTRYYLKTKLKAKGAGSSDRALAYQVQTPILPKEKKSSTNKALQ
jgi:hypothetical protein